MGSQYSLVKDKMLVDDLQGTSMLFSDFCGNVKEMCGQDDIPFCNDLLSLENIPTECDSETIGTIVHLWYKKCLSLPNWSKLDRSLKNQLIQDFLDTLYCTSHAFDEVFLMLFTNAKSRLILGMSDRQGLTSNSLRDIVEDILRYSSTTGLKYYSYNNEVKCLESIADFPLKTFSLCPCTRRPLYVAMYLGRPDVVQLLLKHGAMIPHEDVCNCMEDSRHPLMNVMDILRTTIEHERNDRTSKLSMVRKERSVLTLKLILVDLNHYSSLWINVMDILKELDADVDNDMVPSLKHICRARIRKITMGNFLLYDPHVWNKLGLPQTLASYMNIDNYDMLLTD